MIFLPFSVMLGYGEGDPHALTQVVKASYGFWGCSMRVISDSYLRVKFFYFFVLWKILFHYLHIIATISDFGKRKMK